MISSDFRRISLFFKTIVLVSNILLASCQQRQAEPKPTETVIIDLWDNGLPRKVWLYATVSGVRTPIKEIQYHPNGVKSMEGPLKNGLRHGEWKSWYDDGRLWSVGNFVNGLRHGKGVVYHPNGNKFIEGTYLNGERVGKWSWWDENGRSITELEAIKIAPQIIE